MQIHETMNKSTSEESGGRRVGCRRKGEDSIYRCSLFTFQGNALGCGCRHYNGGDSFYFLALNIWSI